MGGISIRCSARPPIGYNCQPYMLSYWLIKLVQLHLLFLKATSNHVGIHNVFSYFLTAFSAGYISKNFPPWCFVTPFPAWINKKNPPAMFWHVISGGGNQTFSKLYTKTEIHSPKSSISRKWILSRTTQLFVYFTNTRNEK